MDLQTRIDGFAFESQYTEDAFVNAAQWLAAHKAFECFYAECEFAKGERAFSG
jgi:hypothetical protein